MKLYTYQSRDVILELLKDGFVKNNETLMSSEPHIKFCYDMILSYAKENISKEFNEYPIWCWYKTDRVPISDGIKIELEVPDELVVLSDYYDWRRVLLYSEAYITILLRNHRNTRCVFNDIYKNFKNCLNKDMFKGDIQAIVPYIKLGWVTNLDKLTKIGSIKTGAPKKL